MIDPASIALAKGIADATGLTGWIASKFGDSAPVAKAVIDTAVMVSGAKSSQDVVDILSRDSVKAAEVKAAIEAQELELIKLAYTDIQNARDMQKAALAQDDVFSKRFVYYFITFWSVVTIAYVYGITFNEIPANSIRYADTILGFLLGTAVASMFQYLLGTSLSSRTKDNTINLLSKG
jgi:hypothetical protein